MKPGLINKTEELVENGHQLAVASSTECAARERSLTELGVLERNCPQEGLLIW
jgi:beta-phosphoglucomutase-like phosphatase (HAD superfamily)